jgi:multidrug transporter EmrE-like cation transporter
MTPNATGLALLIAALVIESFAQLFLKIAATRVVAWRWVIAGVAAMSVEVALYTAALHLLDVSVAFPIGSLCFVGVALLSKIFLGEAVNRVRWLGVGCILAGAVCVTL